MSLLPLPIEIKAIPEILKQNMDATGQAFCNKINSLMALIELETKGIQDLNDIDKIPDEYLDLLGYTLAAGIRQIDTSLTKRKKILNAIVSHKNRYLWSTLKNAIDGITGGNSSLVSTAEYPMWLMDSDLLYNDYNYAILASDNTVEGMILDSDTTSFGSSGNIYIDLNIVWTVPMSLINSPTYLNDNVLLNHWATYTDYSTDDRGFQYYSPYYFWDQLYNELLNYQCAYMVIHVGYTYQGSFVEVITI
jgi:hypothetical protein